MFTGILYFLLRLVLGERARSVLFYFGGAVLLVNHSLYGYLIINNDLLGSEIFFYSLQDLNYILFNSLSDKTISLSLLPLLVGVLILYFWLNGKLIVFLKAHLRTYPSGVLVILLVIGVTQIQYINPKIGDFSSSVEFKYSHTPISALIENTLESFSKNKSVYSDEELSLAIKRYQLSLKNSDFVSNEYPFLKRFKPYNSLDSLFNLKDKKPNIVVIIVESLSRSFSGKGAYYGSFTPFLDSLSLKSLCWNNFYSNCYRTYGVLPNLFCSTPIGKERGFMNLESIPNHLSLLKLLNNEGYQNGFFYGGRVDFDQTRRFLLNQNVNKIIDKSNFSKRYEVNKAKWGYKDEVLFKKYFEEIGDAPQPYVNTLLTLSIHNPFDQAPQSFNSKVDAIIENNQIESGENIILTNKEVFRNVVYVDSCLKQFFKRYQKQDDYENTIFIITGDHNVQALPLVDELDRYHVPFMIYSPMLKKAKSISSIGTHIDLPITLWSLLSEKYNFKALNYSTWIGSGLRISSMNNSPYFAPISSIKNMGDGIFNSELIIDNKTYQIVDNRLKKETKNRAFKELMDSYFILNDYSCEQNKIYK